MDKETKRFLYWFIIVGSFIAVAVVYCYQVAYILNSGPVTFNCSNMNAYQARVAPSSFEYAFNPYHWSNISVYLNATCMGYQHGIPVPSSKGFTNFTVTTISSDS